MDGALSTPLTRAALDVLTEARGRAKAGGDVWISLEERRRGEAPRPPSRHTFATWWREAEKLASLEHDDRLSWHSLRRQFVTELKDLPLKGLCALGGWKSAVTVLTCYMQADEQTMRRALERRRAVPAEA